MKKFEESMITLSLAAFVVWGGRSAAAAAAPPTPTPAPDEPWTDISTALVAPQGLKPP